MNCPKCTANIVTERVEPLDKGGLWFHCCGFHINGDPIIDTDPLPPPEEMQTEFPDTVRYLRPDKWCVDCGKKIDKRSTRCFSCASKIRPIPKAYHKETSDIVWPVCEICGKPIEGNRPGPKPEVHKECKPERDRRYQEAYRAARGCGKKKGRPKKTDDVNVLQKSPMQC